MSQSITDRDTATLIGAVTAPATHDLMNVLAIIGEHAGLLSDLLQLRATGDMDPAQLQKGLTAIETQVARGRDILTQLNRLAHATDPGPDAFDAAAAVAEIVLLTQRRFHARLTGPAPSHTATCDPMAFRLLVFRLLQGACHPTQAEETPVTLERQDSGLSLTLSGHAPVNPDASRTSLAESLGATLTCHNNTVTLFLPARG